MTPDEVYSLREQLEESQIEAATLADQMESRLEQVESLEAQLTAATSERDRLREALFRSREYTKHFGDCTRTNDRPICNCGYREMDAAVVAALAAPEGGKEREDGGG